MKGSVSLAAAATLGLVALPADVAAQVGTGQPPTTLAVWIEEARLSPFHGLMVAGTQEEPAVGLLVGAGAVAQGTRRPPVTPSPDSVGRAKRIFGYSMIAAFVPMIPALVTSGSTSVGDLVSLPGDLGLISRWVLGGCAATLVSVPIAATVAGTTSIPRTIVGTATGFVAGVAFGGVAAFGLGDYWFVPTYSVTMALATALIAAR